MTDKKKIMLVMLVQDIQHLRKLQDIHQSLKNEFDAHFIFDGYYDKSIDNSSDLLQVSFLSKPSRLKLALSALNLKLARFARTLKFSKFIKKMGKAIFLAFEKLLAQLIERKVILDSQVFSLQNKQQILIDQLKECKADILMLAEANVEFNSELYIQAAHKLGIKVVIIPYTFCAPSEPATHYENDKDFHATPLDIKTLKQKWFYNHNGLMMKRLPTERIKVIEALKISPPKPWIQESSTADALIAESDKIKEHYIKFGIYPKQIHVLGDINHDRLFKQIHDKDKLRKKLCKALRIDESHLLCTFAVFPSYFPLHKSKTEFKSYESVLRYICNKLASVPNTTLLLSLHPSLNPKEYRYLESENVKILRTPVAELIPLSDLFIASISATIKWAIASKVPVINYDVYKFRFGDFIDAPGVINLETKREFDAIIDSIKADKNYLNTIIMKENYPHSDWGEIDGKFCDRLKQLLNKLAKKKWTL